MTKEERANLLNLFQNEDTFLLGLNLLYGLTETDRDDAKEVLAMVIERHFSTLMEHIFDVIDEQLSIEYFRDTEFDMFKFADIYVCRGHRRYGIFEITQENFECCREKEITRRLNLSH